MLLTKNEPSTVNNDSTLKSLLAFYQVHDLMNQLEDYRDEHYSHSHYHLQL